MACSTRTEALVLALLLSGGALAAPPSAEAEARAEVAEGKKAFDLGDFAHAIEHYERAYKLKPAPALLFNLGQGHRRAGNLERASFYFRRYLEANPPAAQAKATEEVLAQVQAQLDAAQKAEVARREAAALRLAEEERRMQEEALHAQQLSLEQARAEAAHAESEATARRLALEASLKPKAPPPVPVYERWWFWTAIGAAVVGGAVTAAAVATAPQPTVTTFPDIDAR